MLCNPGEHLRIDRRALLTAGGVGFMGLSLPELLGAATDGATGRKIAKRAILIWLSGGPSHIDTWDMKLDAPREFRGPFEPIATSAPSITLCEHLPHLATQAHHLGIVRSLGQYGRARNDHHTGYFYNLTGQRPEPPFLNTRRPKPNDAPYLGCVVGAKRPPHPYLPQVITLPDLAGDPPGQRPGQFAARLGVQHDPLVVVGDLKKTLDFKVPSLTLQGEISASRLRDRQTLLGSLEDADQALERSFATTNYSRQQAKAFSILCSPQAKAAFDVSREPESIRRRYGSELNATSMLLARRLIEADVPFVTLFWKSDYEEEKRLGCLAGGWDTHYDNFGCLRKLLLPKFDRPFATLLADLAERGLLEETLVIVTGEMGRKPKIGDPRSGGVKGAGRDHWTHCMSVLLAGGGVQGGQTYGSSDKTGAYPADRPVEPEDIARTIYYAMGIEDLTATDPDGKPFELMSDGEPLTGLF